MKKLFLPFAFFLAAASPVSANGLSMKTVNSVQLTVDNALTNSTRGASSYSLTTNGERLETMPQVQLCQLQQLLRQQQVSQLQ